jgi:trk system potassium uptake protein TrkA
MKIAIVGAGRMGFSLARQLDLEGHEVFVIERNLDLVEQVSSRLDVMAIAGSGSQMRILREAGLEDADLLIAATGSDEVNIVACLLARELGVRRRIARVGSSDLAEDLRETDCGVLGVDEFVHPQQVAVKRLRHMVTSPGTAESAEFGEGRIVLRALRVEENSPLCRGSLQQLRDMFDRPFLVAAVKRNHELFVPSGDFQLDQGDLAYVVMREENLNSFLDAFGFGSEQVKRVLVFGAGKMGQDFCASIEPLVRDVMLVDTDEALCARAAERLTDTSVIHGSPSDRSLLEDLKIEGVDMFLAMSDSDEQNLAPSLLVKRLGVKRAIMLSGHPEHVELFESLPLDGVVSPLLLSVGAIIRSVRTGTVVSLFNLAGTRGEALEVIATAGARGVGRPLKDVNLSRGIVVAAVMNNRDASVAGGLTVVNPGDRVVLVAQHRKCAEAVETFSGGGDS